MSNIDDIEHQKQELIRYRRELAYHLLQKAKYIGSTRDKEIDESIRAVREEIQNIKHNLGACGVSVDNDATE